MQNNQYTKSKIGIFHLLLSFPIVVWLFVFFLIPLLYVLMISFFQRGNYGGIVLDFQFENYVRLFDKTYIKIFINTLKVSFLTSLFCWILAIPISWTIVGSRSILRTIFVMGMIIPFLTNIIVRLYALNSLFSSQGLLSSLIIKIDPQFDTYLLSQNIYITFYGMIISYLPFMVFPLYVAFDQLDFSQIEAAIDLGASPATILLKIILPQLKMASISGWILVFIPCLGEYLIPDLLGGSKVMLLGNLLSEQFLKVRDWPFGAAIGIINIICLVFIVSIIEIKVNKLKWKK